MILHIQVFMSTAKLQLHILDVTVVRSKFATAAACYTEDWKSIRCLLQDLTVLHMQVCLAIAKLHLHTTAVRSRQQTCNSCCNCIKRNGSS